MYTKGVPLLSKMVYKEKVVGPRSGASPYKTPCEQEKRVIKGNRSWLLKQGSLKLGHLKRLTDLELDIIER